MSGLESLEKGSKVKCAIHYHAEYSLDLNPLMSEWAGKPGNEVKGQECN